MIIKRWLIVLLLLFSSIQSKAQDITSGLFESNPLAFNPANAIPGYNEWVFMTNSRQQWWNLPGTALLSPAYNVHRASIIAPLFSKYEKGLGTGINWTRVNSGEGNLAMNECTISNDARFSGKMRRSSYSGAAGVGIGIRQYSLDWSQLTFSSQIDPFRGAIFNSPNVNPQFPNSSISVNGNAGVRIAYTHQTRRKSIYGFKAGIAGFHLNSPAISFFNETSRLHPRYVAHASIVYMPKNKRGLFSKSFANYFNLSYIAQYQGPLSTHETRIGTSVNGILNFYGGVRRKTFVTTATKMDASYWSVQLNLNHVIISAGYEFTISELNQTRTKGTTEIGLIIPLKIINDLLANKRSEPCYADYILTHSDFRSVEQFNTKTSFWGKEFTPVSFIF